MKKFVVVLLLIIVSVSAPIFYSYYYLDQKVLINEDIIVEIPKGSSLHSVAKILNKKGVIEQPRVFAKLGQLYGYHQRIKYGEFLISKEDSYLRVYDRIIKGENVKYPITFVEGEHMYHYAKLIEEKRLGKASTFLKLVRDKKIIKKLLKKDLESLEGYLFPDTYHFSKNDTELLIVATMVNKFLEETETLNFNKLGLDRHKAITLASIVEKETGASFERRKISSVFHNRLKKNMRLQTDPTILYGIMDKTGVETNNIRKKDIMDKTRYNTYVIKGLPPGPIASPGLEAIKAALNPEETSYLYFVSKNDGTHVFTNNYKDHQKAVKHFQLNPKMRKGKSWRDLKKK